MPGIHKVLGLVPSTPKKKTTKSKGVDGFIEFMVEDAWHLKTPFLYFFLTRWLSCLFVMMGDR